MNVEQKKAIKDLEKAFRNCRKVELTFVGCDSDFIALPSVAFYELLKSAEKTGVFGVGLCANHDDAVHVKTWDTYAESGGV